MIYPLIFLYFSNVVFASGICPDNSQIEKVYDCRKNFIENDCDNFADTKFSADLNLCSVEDAARNTAQAFRSHIDSCGQGVSDEVDEILKYLSELTDQLKKEQDEYYHSNDDLVAECLKEFDPTGKTSTDTYLRKHPFDEGYCVSKKGIQNTIGKLKSALKPEKLRRERDAAYHANDDVVAECVKEFDPTGKTSVDAYLRKYPFKEGGCLAKKKALKIKESLAKALLIAEKTLKCFKTESYSRLACPIIVGAISTGGAGTVVKSGMKLASRAVDLDKDIERYFALLEGKADKEKEHRSIGHQKDLIVLSEQLDDVLRRVKADKKQMQMGILDSDMGKISFFWEDRVLKKSKESDQLIRMLQGNTDSAAGKAFTEVLKESGFKKLSFLNPDLSADQVRSAFNENPILRGYLHEIPGFSSAIEDLNKKKNISQSVS